MYFRIQKNSLSRLFTTAQDAYNLLSHYYLTIHQAQGAILDYLLLPYSLDVLLELPTCNTHCMPVEEPQLLPLFAHLAIVGKNYPYCGTFELYHASHCFCELGKAGSKILPFSLETILSYKRNVQIKTVSCL